MTSRPFRPVVRRAGVAVVLLAVGSLVGCSDPEPVASPSPATSDTPTTSSPSPTESSPSATPSASPTASLTGFSRDDVTSPTFPELGGALGDRAVVRVGRHTGYDRVVWEFTGTGRPSYQVRYVATPTADGSGDPVDVAGDAALELFVSSVQIPESPDGCPSDLSPGALSGTVFRQVNAICGSFEGVAQAFVGLDEERPFKVAVLTKPTRLVIDVATG